MTLNCHDLLKLTVEKKGTDLILSAGKHPQIRIDQNLRSFTDEPLSPEIIKDLCYEVMSDELKKEFEEWGEVDFAIGIEEVARFRVNIYKQQGCISGAFRRIPLNILNFEQLNLPDIIRDMSERPNGLVLVTGPTGCGKSTTLAAMLEHINETRYGHIITIEDPIEYIHHHKKATIDQREVNIDTKSYHRALRSILRQNPDVVLLGEMRDRESIQSALTIAETGHLCFSTLHTNSCSQTISRIVDVFPGEKQQQIRSQLSMTLNCVISQLLLPKVNGGMQIVLEIMVATSAIRSLIRENKLHSIDNQIKLGKKFGMQTLNQSLTSAVRFCSISEEDAISVSPDRDDLKKHLYE